MLYPPADRDRVPPVKLGRSVEAKGVREVTRETAVLVRD